MIKFALAENRQNSKVVNSTVSMATIIQFCSFSASYN